jgi:hypothetical protein
MCFSDSVGIQLFLGCGTYNPDNKKFDVLITLIHGYNKIISTFLEYHNTNAMDVWGRCNSCMNKTRNHGIENESWEKRFKYIK